MELQYDRIETQLVEVLPELRPAAEQYWKVHGTEGNDSGAYIFYDHVFACYVEVLLFMPASLKRDNLLKRAFAFLEGMLKSTDEIANLGYISLLEGWSPEAYARAKKFLGPGAGAELNRYQPLWTNWAKAADPNRVPEIIDLYGVRYIVAAELQSENIRLEDVPGKTYVEEVS
jgi:hypothetical protein